MTPSFWKHRTGSSVEYFAVGAALVAAGALFVGYSAQQLASEGDLPTIAFLSPDQYVAKKSKAPSFNSIDYSATGSVNGQKIVLDPCTGRQKSE
ncbi:hypothetical protein [Methylocapsa sp. S129]|uniref:hypothetical protein n=1 Tax=Methylocapsa sp. S129 TaxID=1641869 RepID=UPI00131A864F|nr:hypothetical protein [Methylocapsa sp. S129]